MGGRWGSCSSAGEVVANTEVSMRKAVYAGAGLLALALVFVMVQQVQRTREAAARAN
jgi:hypothetical protein